MDAEAHPVPDYLVIGHVALDITPEGPRMGGSAAYAGLTAAALGLKVAAITSVGPEISLAPLEGMWIHNLPAQHSTTFENTYSPSGRRQRIHHFARTLKAERLKESWTRSRLVHLAPIAGEVDPDVLGVIRAEFIGLTPQGWMRDWDESGSVRPVPWEAPAELLTRAAAVVLSMEDVAGQEDQIQSLAQGTRLLAVTDGPGGARIFWGDDMRHFEAPQIHQQDATGAGDIFAASFFVRLYHTRDPWEAGRFATRLSAASVRRGGLSGVPTREEIEAALEPGSP